MRSKNNNQQKSKWNKKKTNAPSETQWTIKWNGCIMREIHREYIPFDACLSRKAGVF